MKNKLLVSVIIPTYSRPDHLIKSIESVLRQTYYPIEIIVVDDNGRGTPFQIETEILLKEYINKGEIFYIVHEVNKNGSAARNTGWKASKGKYLVFHDDDDIMAPKKIEEQVKAVESSNDIKVKAPYCNCAVYKDEKLIEKKAATEFGQLQYELLAGKWSYGSGSNVLMSRDAFEKLGGYDETFLRHQDMELMVRYFRYFNIINVNQDLLFKINDSKPRIPNIEGMLNIEKYFLDTFKDDIAGYPAKKRNNIYYVRFFELALISANYNYYRFCLHMIHQACTYRFISIKDVLRLFKHLIFKPLQR